VSLRGAPIVVRNLSLGGVSIESSFFFIVGKAETLRFSSLPQSDLGELRSQVVSCYRASGTALFITGFAFLDADTPGVRARIEALIDAARAPASS